MNINKNKTGLTFGLLMASIHLIWGLFVAIGIAQIIVDFIFRIHMLSIPVLVLPFSFTKVLILIIITFIVGYVFGWLMAFFWNRCFKEKKI